MSSEKSSWPGVSSRLNTQPRLSNVMTEVTTEMPRSRSMLIQSERVRRRSPLARTLPASWMAPPARSRCSVSVVLPASGWEMIAKVRRRAISATEAGAAVGPLVSVMGPHAETPGERAARRCLEVHIGPGRKLPGVGEPPNVGRRPEWPDFKELDKPDEGRDHTRDSKTQRAILFSENPLI